MTSKTLYVSDLDGTLLRKDQRLSPFTVETVNALAQEGMLFSYATARSNFSAGQITAALSKNIPVIVLNGTFILENGTGKRLLSNLFTREESAHILRTLMAGGVYPFVYAFVDGAERVSYSESHLSEDMHEFLGLREFDPRRRPTTPERMFDGEIFHIVCMDSDEKLAGLYESLKPLFGCHYGKDMYSGKPWLEIHPKSATKANAILELKRILGCDRVICFGDGKNDISMFGIADECYAVENADPALKKIATAVIGSNEEDSVAKWLQENVICE